MDFENIKLEKINCVVEYTPKLKRWEAKNRHDHIVGLQIKGCAKHDFGYKKFNIEEDCVYFLNQKDDYSVQVFEQTSAFSVHFTTYEPIDTESFCLKVGNSSEIFTLLKKIQKLHTTNPKGNNETCSIFYTFCSYIDRIRRKNYSPKDERIIEAKEHIDRCFTEKECLEQATRLTNLSRRRFNDLFVAYFGSTPNRYVTVRKIELACQLLSIGTFTVSEISDKCGFNDIYYFSKVFKQETGLPPTLYRKNPIV